MAGGGLGAEAVIIGLGMGGGGGGCVWGRRLKAFPVFPSLIGLRGGEGSIGGSPGEWEGGC